MPPKITNNRWDREPDDFAVVLRERDLSGMFSRRIIIEDGTIGLLMVQGRFDKRLDPGEHVLEGGLGALLGGRDRKDIVLVNLGEVMLHLTLPRLLTRDPVPFGVQTALTLRFTSGREAIFLSNFMSGRDYLGANDLRQLVYSEFNEAAQAWSGGHTIRELGENMALRDEMAISMEAHIRPVLERYGLSFGRLQVRDFNSEIWDRSVNQRVETSLQVTKEQAELEGRKRFFDIAVETDIQDVTEETQKVATYEKRILLWQRMQRAANQEQMDKISSEQDLTDFIRQTDRDHLLKEDELERFKQALVGSGEDRERLRAQMIRLTDMEADYDFKRKELAQQASLSQEQLEGELGLERLRMESQLETALKRAELTLVREREEGEHRRREDELDAAARWERELQEARTNAEAQNIGRETARLDGELGLALQAKQAAQERLNQQEQVNITLQRQADEQELAIKADEAQLDLRLRELRDQHQRELDSMQSMDAVSLHTLIAVAPGEKAPLLAELARTEALKSLSPDRILAIAAEKSPELGGALAEMAAQGGSEQAKAMYERILEEQKGAAADMRESQREMTETMREMFNKALETQAQVASAFAQGAGQAAQAQTPAAGAPGAAAQRVVVCRRCLQESATGTRYCPNCGDTLMNEPR